MTDCYISKGLVWEILGEDSAAFAIWLSSGTDMANAVKIMFEHTGEVNLTGPTISMVVLPALVANNVISSTTLDRINTYISQNSGVYVDYV